VATKSGFNFLTFKVSQRAWASFQDLVYGFACSNDVASAVKSADFRSKGPVFFYQGLFIAADGLVKLEELGDQHGYHGEKTNVFLKGYFPVKETVYCEQYIGQFYISIIHPFLFSFNGACRHCELKTYFFLRISLIFADSSLMLNGF
jgi:hypothetical protein